MNCRLAVIFSIAFSLGIQASGVALAQAPPKSEKDKKLYQKAWQTCNGPQYPNGSRIVINYKKGWFRCEVRYRYR